MVFTVRMGIPEMEYYWEDMCIRESKGELDKVSLSALPPLSKA